MGTKVNLYKQSNKDDGIRVNFNVPRSLTYGLNARANDDGGVSEADNCTYNTLNGINTLLSSASLMLTPSSYKEGKLYSVIPSNGNGDFTVTRATTATRVNSDGLVELVPYNLLRHSENFAQTTWQKPNLTIITNVATAPNGTLTASSFSSSNVSTYHPLYSINSFALNTYTYSIYVKKVNSRFFSIKSVGGSTNWAAVIFDLDTATTTKTQASSMTIQSTNIESVGDNWYRASLTFTGLISDAGVQFSDSATASFSNYADIIATGTGLIDYYVWGAQLVEGSTALPYQKTETRLNIPRLDYSLGGCPNILLEPQRTNLALQSSSFDSASWTKINSTISANTTTSPSGIQDADTFTGDGVNTAHQVLQTGVSTLTSGTTYTTSIYAKKGTNDFIQIVGTTLIYPSNTFANFDLNNGTLGSTGGGATSSITSVGNGWYRCSMTATAIATNSSNSFIVIIVTSATSPRAESNTLTTSVYLWGAQVEAGSYATSYIPTTAASVTRNLDDSTLSSFTSGIGQTEGVLFTEVTFGSTDNGNKWIAFLWLSGSSYIGIYTASNGRILAEIVNSGVQFASTSSVFALPNEKHKIALAYKANDFAFYIDGVQIALDNSGTVPACNQVRFNYNTTATNLTQRYYSSLILWKERLTNAQLAQLTTI